jgi:hypothetical protein
MKETDQAAKDLRPVAPRMVIDDNHLRLGKPMRTALDEDPSELDEHERNFIANIRQHGWFATFVFADGTGPNFTYTTGFWLNVNFPEIITFSLKKEIVHDTLWHLYRELKRGEKFAVGEPVENVFANLKATLLPVAEHQFEDHLGWSRWFYRGDRFRCLQLVWPDRSGKFPWQAGFSAEMIKAQPDLTEGNWFALRQH